MQVATRPFDKLLSRIGLDPDKGRETPPELATVIDELDALITKIPQEQRDLIFTEKYFPEIIQQTRNLVQYAGNVARRARIHSSSINTALHTMAIDLNYVSLTPLGLYAFVHIDQLETFKNKVNSLIS